MKYPNACEMRVTYADGCVYRLKLRNMSAEAKDPVKFALWLRKQADDIFECATTPGMCAPETSNSRLTGRE